MLKMDIVLRIAMILVFNTDILMFIENGLQFGTMAAKKSVNNVIQIIISTAIIHVFFYQATVQQPIKMEIALHAFQVIMLIMDCVLLL
jgi:hypothetical protein